MIILITFHIRKYITKSNLLLNHFIYNELTSVRLSRRRPALARIGVPLMKLSPYGVTKGMLNVQSGTCLSIWNFNGQWTMDIERRNRLTRSGEKRRLTHA